MTQPVCIADSLADLDHKVAALERGLVQYQHGVSSWTSDALARVTRNVGSLELMGKDLAHRETSMHKDRAEIERQHAQAVEVKKACETRERELNELAELLAQAQRDAATQEKKLRAEFEQKRRELEAAELSLSEKMSQSEGLRASSETLAREVEVDSQRLQESRAQWERACAEQQVKFEAQTKELQRQSEEVHAKVEHCAQEDDCLRTLAQQFDERKNQLESRETDLAAREKDLVDRERGLCDAQAAYGVRECRLEESLQQMEADRAELAAARETFEAQRAAAQILLEHEQGQLHVKLENACQREHELQNERTAIERSKEEFERRLLQAGEREGDLVAHQAKLETALASIQNDRLAVQTARTMADEVAQARSDELAKSRQEVDALRAEIAGLRHAQDDLQKDLREACDSAQREAAAAGIARGELQVAAAQAESSKVAATESAQSEYQQKLQKAEAAIAEIRAE